MASPGLLIAYQAEDFPDKSISNGHSELNVTWDDILWAAVTIARPYGSRGFRNVTASGFEAVRRWSTIRTAIEQSNSSRPRLQQTNSFIGLDPTEKGFINYFVGMTFCKLFASKILDRPWLLHLDIYKDKLGVIFKRGKSRPDFIGRSRDLNKWYAFECKGRSSPPGDKEKAKAKRQARRVRSVSGKTCAMHIAAITYFKSNVLQFYWCDPPIDKYGVDIPFQSTDWSYYYSPIVGYLKSQSSPRALILRDRLSEGPDIEASLHSSVRNYLLSEQWEFAQKAAIEAKNDIVADGYQPDGILVKAGESWLHRFKGPLNSPF